ncbi:MAG: hypothetical protein NC217_07085 [Muribaculaceae bacterium]|nr:hypothetical protein [Muribaculaceae bacterium]
MKKVIFSAAIVAVLALTSCGGHSGATGEQIDKAKKEAKEMLDNTKKSAAQQTEKTQVQQPAAEAPADTI